MTAPPGPRAWWDEGVLYQIYVRSFQDADGDGIGDLDGVRSRLDHLAWLGVDGIWLNPIHPSPNRDWGYDVADHLDVAADYGGLPALDRLIGEASERGIRILLDLVPNHTSERHPWFVEARRDRDSPMRDRYVWADPGPDGGPPNNWRSHFGGPAWTFDETTGQYYLHLFLPEQPDLNWWNDEVREAFDHILRFWFDRGVAGFRIDVANAIVKDRELRDDPPSAHEDDPADAPASDVETFSQRRPEVHDVLARWRTIADDADPPRVLLGEAWARSFAELARYYGEGQGLHLVFNFAFATAPFDGEALGPIVEATEEALGTDAWPVWTASNHDIGRLASRWGEGDPARIRCALFLLLLLRGTPVLYAGDEIGLCDVPVPQALRRDPGNRADGSGRDDGRTPMIWTGERGHGFTSPGTDPWLPFGDGHRSVADQRADATSVLTWCRDVIAFRRAREELRRGAQEPVDAPPGVFAWRRHLVDEGPSVVAAANVSPVTATVELPAGTVVLASDRARDGRRAGPLSLEPWGCVVVSTDER